MITEGLPCPFWTITWKLPYNWGKGQKTSGLFGTAMAGLLSWYVGPRPDGMQRELSGFPFHHLDFVHYRTCQVWTVLHPVPRATASSPSRSVAELTRALLHICDIPRARHHPQPNGETRTPLDAGIPVEYVQPNLEWGPFLSKWREVITIHIINVNKDRTLPSN